ncbi:MAG: hypothetical protein J6O04_12040 [Selenomonadaceae bacterium]|nr:hypothetical protein [Selenomonadaceae bacterium]
MLNRIDEYINFAFQSEIIKKTMFFLCLILIFIMIYGFNRHTPLIVDDFAMKNVALENDFWGILGALYNYYFTWGGRIIVHAIAYFFLSMDDRSIFNIVNTFCYIALNFLILFHGFGKMVFSSFALVMLNLMLFLFTPVFGQDFLWLDGAANYLWGIVIVLTFFIPYRLQLAKTENIFKHEKLALLPILIFGIIAAWTNENLSLALVFMIFVSVLVSKKYSKHIYLWQIVGGIGAVIGAAFLILAPGNFNRMAVEAGGQHVDIVKNFFDINGLYVDPHFLLYPIFFTILLAVISFNNQDKFGINDGRVYLVYLAGVFVSMYAMLGSPYYTDRAKLGSLVLTVILTVYFYGRIKFNTVKQRKVLLVIGIFLTFLLHEEWHIASGDIKAYDRIEEARVAQIVKERSTNNDIVIEDNNPHSRYVGAFGLERISHDKNSIWNRVYAKFYKAASVRIR